jgi:uncharacterized repeat protein (TIGR01451 family)
MLLFRRGQLWSSGGNWYARLLTLATALVFWANVLATSESPAPRAPLLYVQLKVPTGYTLTFLSKPEATAASKTPNTVGLKPGYGYWLRLQGPPGERETYYPLLEVVDTLPLPSRLKAWDLPVPLAITDDDLLRLQDGKLITKVVVAEYDPSTVSATRATPASFRLPDEENEVPASGDLIREAERFGQPLIILRLGNRQLEPQEWSQPPQPLTPGSYARARRSRQPSPAPDWHSPSVHTPARNAPAGSIRDGGDGGEPAHRTPEGQLGGIEPGDAVAEFADSAGRRKIAVANPVYLLAPRFLTFYQVHGLGRVRSELSLRPVSSPIGREIIGQRQTTNDTRARTEVERLQSQSGLRANLSQIPSLRVVASQELAATRLDIPKAQAVSVPLTTESVTHLQCDPCDDPQRQPLRLQKWASAQAARSGEIVTFYLRYCNASGKPLRDVAIVDSLSPRLEYVAGSARSDREAIFVLQENAAGGQVLRWEIRDPLPPAAQGIISFQVRVR